MSASSSDVAEGNIWYLLGLLTGGLVLGFGVMNLPYSFGRTGPKGNCFNCEQAVTGFSAIDNITTLPAADYSIGMVVAGLLMLVALNAGAWRRTGGY
ncbi:MAG: hypothetical protein KTR31_38430 [Myxococcales bacterium]|nr:hypothetical protein [Myxococcales bacterium]